MLCYSGDPLTTETYVLFNTTVRLDEIRDVARRLLDQENHGCIYLEDDCVDFKVQSKISNLQGDKVYGRCTHFEIIFFHTPLLSAPCLDFFYLGLVTVVVFLWLVIPEAIQSGSKTQYCCCFYYFCGTQFHTSTALCIKSVLSYIQSRSRLV